MKEELTFDDVVVRHRDAMLATALRVTGRAVLAEDATQEAFIVLHRKFDDLSDREKLGPWLKLTVRRIARDMLRKERVPASPLLDQQSGPDEDIPSGSRLVDAENSAYALSALAALPSSDREILLATMLGVTSHDALAEYFQTTPTIIKGRLQRARARLSETGHSPQAIAKQLKKEDWPENYVERCRESALARNASIQAFWHWADMTSGAIRLMDRKPLDRAYEACQSALALDPYNATNHAIAAELCISLASYAYLKTLSTGELARLKGLGDIIGRIPREKLEQARAHAGAAERLDPRNADVIKALSSLLTYGAPSRDELPTDKLYALAIRHSKLAPDRLDVAGDLLFTTALDGREPDLDQYLECLDRYRGKALDRSSMMAVIGAARLMIRTGHPKAASRILDELEQQHEVREELQQDLEHQVKSYRGQLEESEGSA